MKTQHPRWLACFQVPVKSSDTINLYNVCCAHCCVNRLFYIIMSPATLMKLSDRFNFNVSTKISLKYRYQLGDICTALISVCFKDDIVLDLLKFSAIFNYVSISCKCGSIEPIELYLCSRRRLSIFAICACVILSLYLRLSLLLCLSFLF